MLAASYRPVMQQVQRARSIGVPFFLMSASITPGMEPHLAGHTLITSPAIIRQPTYRPELGFGVWPKMFSARTEAAEALAKVLRCWIGGALLGEDGKVVVYCRTLKDVETAYRALMGEVFGEEGEECLVTGVPLVYTGQLGEEAQQEVLDRLLKPTTFGDRVVIATTALGLGLDDPLVMGILWLGAPSDVIVLDQQLGRAGRGKRNGFGIIFNAPGQTSSKDGDHSHLAWSGDGDIFGRQAMSDTISARDICRRWRMAEVLDGAGVSCMSIGAGDMMCDVCWEQAWGVGSRPFWMPGRDLRQWGPHKFTERDGFNGNVPSRLVKGGVTLAEATDSTSVLLSH